MVVKLTSASAEDAQYFVFNMIATDFCNILEYRIFLDAIQNQYIGIGFSFFVKAWPGRSTYVVHSAYRYNIKCQKCAGMGLNGFHVKKIFSTQVY